MVSIVSEKMLEDPFPLYVVRWPTLVADLFWRRDVQFDFILMRETRQLVFILII